MKHLIWGHTAYPLSRQPRFRCVFSIFSGIGPAHSLVLQNIVSSSPGRARQKCDRQLWPIRILPKHHENDWTHALCGLFRVSFRSYVFNMTNNSSATGHIFSHSNAWMQRVPVWSKKICKGAYHRTWSKGRIWSTDTSTAQQLSEAREGHTEGYGGASKGCSSLVKDGLDRSDRYSSYEIAHHIVLFVVDSKMQL